MLEKLRKRLEYVEYKPLYYTDELMNLYCNSTVTGGEIAGKSVLITGGTGGIGLALAKRFLFEGCNVTISGRNEEKLRCVVSQTENRHKGKLSYVVMDQLNIMDLTQCVKELYSSKKYIDIWINNAGIFTDEDKEKKFRSIRKSQYRNIIDTNLISTIQLSKLVAECMESRGGSIINIASICGVVGSFLYTPYGISKAGVISGTQKLSEIYKNKGVQIIAIAPGSVATKMGNLKIGDNISRKCGVLNRASLPEEIASLAAFLSTSTGKYVSGQTIIASACEEL